MDLDNSSKQRIDPIIGTPLDGELIKADKSTIASDSQIPVGNGTKATYLIIAKPQSAKVVYSPAQIAAILKEFKLSKLSIDDYCKQINTPSPATLRKWLKLEEKECPECKAMRIKIATLEAKLEVYERQKVA